MDATAESDKRCGWIIGRLLAQPFADFCGLKIPLGAMQIERRAMIQRTCGWMSCIAGFAFDIHAVRDEWRETLPTAYPSVPVHKIIGRLEGVGPS